MLAYVPVRFDLYRAVRSHLRWTLQNLVAFADRAGKCWPSSRTLAAAGGLSKSTAARHLADLVRDGHATRERERCPGGGWRFVYRIAAQFLPAAAREPSGVPPARVAVSHRAPAEEKTFKKTFQLAGFLKGSELPDPTDRWQARVRSWIRSGGKFWLADWGPRPNEAGCWVPASLLEAGP